ncbi:hypothetical protein [Photobacterium damselae]|uniref:hypothetical protein n=1 Tax=Photobacterium damselae TaxID=38293 RepID=UPI004068AAFF
MKNYFNKYVSQITFIFIGFYSFAVIYAFSIDSNKTVIDVLNSIGVFLSSGGAIVAFITLLHVIFTKYSDQENKEIEYSNYILLILDRQYRFLNMVNDDVKKQIKYNKFKNATDKALSLRITEFDNNLIMPIQLERILFLLSTGRPEIVAEIDQCQRDFMYLAKNVSNRNDLFVNDYQKNVQTLLKPGQKFIKEEIEEKIGSAVIPSLEYSTNNILMRLDNLSEEIAVVQKELLSLLGKQYPDRKFIRSVYANKSA